MVSPRVKKRFSLSMDLAPVVRVALVVVLVLLQMLLILALVLFLRSQSVLVYAALQILCNVVMIYFLAYNEGNGAFKDAWVIVVMLLGVFGLLLYLFWGRSTLTNALDKRLKRCLDKGEHPLPQNPQTLAAYEGIQSDALQRVGRYLGAQKFSIYDQTASTFYSLGEQALEAMLTDIQAATSSVYLEFFIIFEGEVWERFIDALTQKVAQGLDVRLMYDDMGSIVTSSPAFHKRLRGAGIQFAAFNPVHHHVHQLYLNYRDHRKILVVDQRIAYTGGLNLADEYANLYQKHGHWKDTAVRLQGPGVEAYTRFFLTMWHAVRGGDCRRDLDQVVAPAGVPGASGFVVPFEDGPHNNPSNPAECLYRQMIATAQRYVYITSPYLVVDEPMIRELHDAADSGVDVRILIPKIPDHWYVHWTSLSFAGPLLRAGVRIFLYTPGFVHAKMIVADDRQCVVGSVNLDYRSFYLQYECGCWFAQGEMPRIVHEDICKTLDLSEELTLEQWKKRSPFMKALQPVLRLFGPLM